MILDSTFLVDYEREVRRRAGGPAHSFLSERPHTILAVTFTVAGELAAGDSLGADRAKWENFIRPFQILGFTQEIAWRFGGIYRDLRRSGNLIGANDMWIAATALVHDRPLVTRNVDEFSRVHGLTVLGY